MRGYRILRPGSAIAWSHDARSALAPYHEPTVCADTKPHKVRLHDLRHTADSHAVMSGENLPLVGRLLRHRRHQTRAGYAHVADTHLVQVPETVGSIIAEAMR